MAVKYDVRALVLVSLLAFLIAWLWYDMPDSWGIIKEVFLFFSAIASINIIRVARKTKT